MSRHMMSFTSSVTSHVPADVDQSEPDCIVTFRWDDEEKPSRDCPGCPESLELLSVKRGDRDILKDASEECRVMWEAAAWEAVAVTKERREEMREWNRARR